MTPISSWGGAPWIVGVTACLALTWGHAQSASSERAREWIADLHEAGRLPGAGALDPAPQVLAFFERLDTVSAGRGPTSERAADLRLPWGTDSDPFPVDALAAPWTWRTENRAYLDEHLQVGAPTLTVLEELLTSEVVRDALAMGRPLRNVQTSRVLPAFSMRDLRHWSNLLAGSALDLARRGQASHAAERIAWALDLAFVLDTGTSVDSSLALMQESNALASLQTLLETGLVPAVTLRGALEPRLARAGRDSRVAHAAGVELLRAEALFEDALAGEVESWTRSGREVPDPPVAGEAMIALLHLFERVTGAEEPCGLRRDTADGSRVYADLQFLSHTLHGHERRLALARVALAARVHRDTVGSWPERPEELEGLFPGGVPQSPCVHRSYELVPRRDLLLVTLPLRLHAGPELRSLHDDKGLGLWILRAWSGGA